MKIPSIPDKLFFKIGEVADLVGIEQHVLGIGKKRLNLLNPKKINLASGSTKKRILS